MITKLKIVGHIAYYMGLCLLVTFACTLVYSPLPYAFGLTLHFISMVIIGLVMPTGKEGVQKSLQS